MTLRNTQHIGAEKIFSGAWEREEGGGIWTRGEGGSSLQLFLSNVSLDWSWKINIFLCNHLTPCLYCQASAK